MKEKKENSQNGTLMLILLAVVAVFVLFFPKIYNFVSLISVPKVEVNKTNENNNQNEAKELDENILETIHYPLMRSSVYDANTYYSLDKFTINDLSNNDILLNAFLDIYEGNMTPYEFTGACTTISKQFSKQYLVFRIQNILSNKIEYTLTDFYVPEDLDTQYVGTWNYDSINNRFVYVGLCGSKATNIKYYDLEELIKIEYNDNDIDAYYYVGFAKVEGNSYTLYKNPNMTEEITNGTFTSLEDLNSIYKKLNKKNKKIYKYTFKNTLCKYNEYCLYEGKWVSDI